MKNEVIESDQPHALRTFQQGRTIEITHALPVRLQTLDLARHIAIDPAGKRYVVATFDDNRLERGYITAVYPQQNDYLTLIRLMICESSSTTFEQATQLHISTVQAIQQGKLAEIASQTQAKPVVRSIEMQ